MSVQFSTALTHCAWGDIWLNQLYAWFSHHKTRHSMAGPAGSLCPVFAELAHRWNWSSVSVQRAVMEWVIEQVVYFHHCLTISWQEQISCKNQTSCQEQTGPWGLTVWAHSYVYIISSETGHTEAASKQSSYPLNHSTFCLITIKVTCIKLWLCKGKDYKTISEQLNVLRNCSCTEASGV